MDPATDQKDTAQSTLNNPDNYQEPRPVVVRREPERVIFSWQAPARPFQRRTRQFYVTTFAMAGIVSLIIFLAEGLIPVILIISLVFLYYILSTVEPERVEYQITNKGIKIAGKRTEWQLMNRFWFANRFNHRLLVIETFSIPGRLEFVVTPDIEENITKELSAYIPHEEAPLSGLDKITGWVAQKLPGNK